MLVNLTPKNDFRTQRTKHRTGLIRELGKLGIIGPKSEWIRFEHLFKSTKYTGVYNSDFDGDVINAWCKQTAYFSNGYRRNHRETYFRSKIYYWYFGVADNIEQVIDFYNKNECGLFSGNHVISYFEVRKSPTCGWRWHKWGPYIGTQEPQCEYLADEPEIEKVICFSIYKVR